MTKLNKEFWENKYIENELGWDIGYVSTPIQDYIDQLKNKETKILIPGAGNGHEAIYLHNNGFTNVQVIDIASQPLKNIKERCPSFPTKDLLQIDFFEFEGASYDLILEQTFFCAIDPVLRTYYVTKMHSLLGEHGKLAGLLFSFPLSEDGPPFGGSITEYISIFKNYFTIRVLEKAHNSIKPRDGNELFFIFEKQN